MIALGTKVRIIGPYHYENLFEGGVMEGVVVSKPKDWISLFGEDENATMYVSASLHKKGAVQVSEADVEVISGE